MTDDPMNYDPPPFPEFERVEHAQQSTASDLPLIWKGWANALRLMDSKRTEPDPAAQAQADAYEQCATELREALSARSPAEMEDLTLQICFDKVVKERDALRTQVEGAAKELADARFHLLSNRTLEADRAIGRALSKITSTDRACTCGGDPGQPADHHDISCPAAITSTVCADVTQIPNERQK